MNLRRRSRNVVAGFLGVMICCGWALAGHSAMPDADALMDRFGDHCFECHGYGESEGGFSFEDLGDGKYGEDSLARWEAVWKNVRSETMPPSTHDERPDQRLRGEWLDWINRDVFGLSSDRIDPGRVVLRRLNRNEYKQTIVDLLDVEIDVNKRLPPDDTGYGFDTIGETLTLSPVLLEKYIAAAEDIVDEVIPSTGPSAPIKNLDGWAWKWQSPLGKPVGTHRSIAQPQRLWFDVDAPVAGDYRLNLNWTLQYGWIRTAQTASLDVYCVASRRIDESASSDQITQTLDGLQPIARQTVGYNNHQPRRETFDLRLPAGKHWICLRLTPQNRDHTPLGQLSESPADYEFYPHGSSFEGPLSPEHVRYNEKTARVLFNGPLPDDAMPSQRIVHTAAVIDRFAGRAFRRPIDRPTLMRLTRDALAIADLPGKRYEDGVAMAIKRILVSPRFLYRGETPMPGGREVPLDAKISSVPIDDHSLATRLSYFLWGTTPDVELLEVAGRGELNDQLDQQIDRMIDNHRNLYRGVENFVGQWLRTRDLDRVSPNGRAILRTRDQKLIHQTYNWTVKNAMGRETHEFFKHLIINDRPIHELLNADYTYLNGPLARFYGIEGVHGRHMRRVELPADAHRRGILTHASVLLVTSNPTRTSPVKRGLFILENLLGVPGPPAPPDVPELSESAEGDLHDASLREVLAAHRDNAACASCHSRMDPLGLALENYNAWGQYTDVTYPPREHWWQSLKDQPLPVDAGGTLMTGESFDSVEELADILASERRDDFYRCITEKWLTFAIGRGLTYRDTTAVDKIVDNLRSSGGSTRTLIREIVRSAAFSHMRVDRSSVASR